MKKVLIQVLLTLSLFSACFAGRSARQIYILSDLDKSLIDAAKKGDIDGVRVALEKGANVNAKFSPPQKTTNVRVGEFSALYFAAVKKNNLKLVKLLIEKGADVNAKSFKIITRRGTKPRVDHFSILKSMPKTPDTKEVREFLISKGAK